MQNKIKLPSLTKNNNVCIIREHDACTNNMYIVVRIRSTYQSSLARWYHPQVWSPRSGVQSSRGTCAPTSSSLLYPSCHTSCNRPQKNMEYLIHLMISDLLLTRDITIIIFHVPRCIIMSVKFKVYNTENLISRNLEWRYASIWYFTKVTIYIILSIPIGFIVYVIQKWDSYIRRKYDDTWEVLLSCHDHALPCLGPPPALSASSFMHFHLFLDMHLLLSSLNYIFLKLHFVHVLEFDYVY